MFMVNVGEYTSPMDPMCYKYFLNMHPFPFRGHFSGGEKTLEFVFEGLETLPYDPLMVQGQPGQVQGPRKPRFAPYF